MELCGIDVNSAYFHPLWNKTCLRGIKLGERGIQYIGAWNKTMGAWKKMCNKKGILWIEKKCTWNHDKNRNCGINASWNQRRNKPWNYVE